MKGGGGDTPHCTGRTGASVSHRGGEECGRNSGAGYTGWGLASLILVGFGPRAARPRWIGNV